MLLLILRIAYFCVCAGAILGYFYSGEYSDVQVIPNGIGNHPIFSFIVLLLITQVVTVVDIFIRKKRIDLISATYFGILVGVLLANLMIQAISLIIPPDNLYHQTMVLVILLLLPYLCVSLLLQTRDDFRFVIPYVEFARNLKGGRLLVVDSSSLIDGRISEVVETQILEAQLIIPDFVLSEMQDIADSNDKNRRLRGRRGLEVLAQLQQSSHTDVRMHETKKGEFRSMSVDQKLVKIASQLRASVITNDFNLNKVASIQGIDVINLNDVANALRPHFIPGERLKIRILREGDGPGQGIGYLEDGTMVVCEGGGNMIGREINSIVTSLLQSTGGRMIFAKPVHSARGDS